jgi:DNA-damage-inducible protein D
MTKRKLTQSPITGLLNDDRVRRAHHADQTFYSIIDLIQILTETRFPNEYWDDLKKREPALAAIEERLETDYEGQTNIIAAVDTPGVFRLIQSIFSPQAEKLKRWLAESAAQRLEELENPELAILRMRKSYEDKGYSPRWIDKRLRGVSARQELTSEWGRRGADQSEKYRALTNAIMEGVFGMDVERLRRYKNLQRPADNLRDYMSDLELVLTSLAETAAVALHRNRASHGLDELVDDAREAGRIAGDARSRIEQASAHKPRGARTMTTTNAHG